MTTTQDKAPRLADRLAAMNDIDFDDVYGKSADMILDQAAEITALRGHANRVRDGWDKAESEITRLAGQVAVLRDALEKERLHAAASDLLADERLQALLEARANVDLSQWENARFGYFNATNEFVEFKGDDNELPNDSSPRWVGGKHDLQLLRAALAATQPVAPTEQAVVHQHGFAASNQTLRTINNSLDKQLEEVMQERDERDDVLASIAHLIDREFTSAYGFADLVSELDERLAAPPQPQPDAVDAARYRWLRDMRPCSFTLGYNDDHTSNYMTASEWIDNNSDWFSDCPADEIQKMRDANTIWTLQVYPNTPVGFNVWSAASLDAAIDAAMKGQP